MTAIFFSGSPSADLDAYLCTVDEINDACRRWLRNRDTITAQPQLSRQDLYFYLRGREARVSLTNVCLLVTDTYTRATAENVKLNDSYFEATLITVARYVVVRSKISGKQVE